MDNIKGGQVNRSAAEVYEDFFVPALFGEWGPRVADAAGVAKGNSVLDVACGTGVFARAALTRVGDEGSVTGTDCNPGMLEVARRRAPEVTWEEGFAEALSYDDASFDSIGCQFSLMFFEDRKSALAEMWRVLKPGGRLAVAVWDKLENSPGYAAMVGLITRLFGADTAKGLMAPFCLGEIASFQEVLDQANLGSADIETLEGKARFPSIADWVHTDVKGWTLADVIDDTQYQILRTEAGTELARFARPDGSVSFAAPAHIATVVKS